MRDIPKRPPPRGRLLSLSAATSFSSEIQLFFSDRFDLFDRFAFKWSIRSIRSYIFLPCTFCTFCTFPLQSANSAISFFVSLCQLCHLGSPKILIFGESGGTSCLFIKRSGINHCTLVAERDR